MNVGRTIAEIRKEKGMSQEEFGRLFHVTRQTVSNWENEKSYPDLQTIVAISDLFAVSLDKLLKEDKQMIQTLSKRVQDGIKWNIVKKVVLAAMVLVLVSLMTFIIIWGIQKKKLEEKFVRGTQVHGFELTENGYYELEDGKKSYMLPNQKMPSPHDFHLDFHAKYLVGRLSLKEGTIICRWMDTDVLFLSMEWKGQESEAAKSYLVDQEGKTLGKKVDVYWSEPVPENVEEMIDKYNNEVRQLLEEGTRIYEDVYK